ncbi:NAD(P)/FAD-dependent oxidoreductase [Coralliovum pocilloporae]|uniref:NAD(P)/FAD-dependent oxidoreductase n=1 Tax=Coralliovum pocilloporae TaxID=3066369 RepID=UPI003306DA99
MTKQLVIVGAGQAAATLVEQLHREGYDGEITVLGDETVLPYQRPPLSKDYFKGATDVDRLVLRPAAYYDDAGVTMKMGTRVASIDRESKTITTDQGEAISYDTLVLGTGARPRPLPMDGMDADNVVTVRDIADADRMKAMNDQIDNVVVVGGGFIGLEAAAVLRGFGKNVTVVEAAPRLMGRAVSEEVSEAFLNLHRQQGIDVRLNTGVSGLVSDGHQVQGVTLADGTELAADLVIVGIGAIPNDELAQAAGVSCDGGILTDLSCRTSDADIYAMGDCTRLKHGRYDALLRLESVQNAIDQARIVADSILGKDVSYGALPWFWSDQFDAKLQIAGLLPDGGEKVSFGSYEDGGLLVVHFDADGTFAAAETINRAGDHMASRRIIDMGMPATRDMIIDAAGDMKSVMKALR